MSIIDAGAVDGTLVDRLRKLFQIEDGDLGLVKEAGVRVLPHITEIVDGLYEHILSFPELAAAFRDETSLQRARGGQIVHLGRLFSGHVDEEYVREGLRIGSVHDAMGVEPSWYLAGYVPYTTGMLDYACRATQTLPEDHPKRICKAMMKIVLLDICLAWEEYHARRTKRIMDAYRALETNHNMCLKIVEERDKEIEDLRRRLEPTT